MDCSKSRKMNSFVTFCIFGTLLFDGVTSSSPENCFKFVRNWDDILYFKGSGLYLNVNEDDSLVSCLENRTAGLYYYRLEISYSNDSELIEDFQIREFLDLEERFLKYVYENGHYNLSFNQCDERGCNSDSAVLSSVLKIDERFFEMKNQGGKIIFHLSPRSSAVRLYSAWEGRNCSVHNDDLISLQEEIDSFKGNIFAINASQLEPHTFYCLESGEDIFGPFFIPSQESPPFIAALIPYCTSHFRCAWIYILVLGSGIFVLSFCLTFTILYCGCCCCRRGSSRKGRKDSLPRRALVLDSNKDHQEIVPFQAITVDNVPERKTWSDLHSEWEKEPPKNPGKILLLYSRDSKSFAALQMALKSFLESAIHCIVLDLFDDNLFEQIALDPEKWMKNLLLRDPDFKIIVISSRGASKRFNALKNGEVLNIPDNSSLDGLFSSGLKFVRENKGCVSLMATASYETLYSELEDERLGGLSEREFRVPTELHELFCWIHGYNPLDLIGKPWDKYHLELQLLQDALKNARYDARKRN